MLSGITSEFLTLEPDFNTGDSNTARNFNN